MTSDIVENILMRIGHPELVDVLTQQLSGTELNSVLLEVFYRKTASMTAPELLNQYQSNRLVMRADLPVLQTRRMELEVLELFNRYSFQPVQLSPVTVLGACSIVAPASQKKILSALRGTEVLADSTNALALHASNLKERNRTASSPGQVIRFCNIQRQVRTQALTGKGFTPHFTIGCLVSCGRDSGAFTFEKAALTEHVEVMKRLFGEYYKVDELTFRLLERQDDSASASLFADIAEHLQKQHPDVDFKIIQRPEKENNYYKGVQYKIDISLNGKKIEIGDGGFVDWTQQLLQNKKERMLSTGFGFDLMGRVLMGEH